MKSRGEETGVSRSVLRRSSTGGEVLEGTQPCQRLVFPERRRSQVQQQLHSLLLQRPLACNSEEPLSQQDWAAGLVPGCRDKEGQALPLQSSVTREKPMCDRPPKLHADVPPGVGSSCLCVDGGEFSRRNWKQGRGRGGGAWDHKVCSGRLGAV